MPGGKEHRPSGIVWEIISQLINDIGTKNATSLKSQLALTWHFHVLERTASSLPRVWGAESTHFN